MDNSEKINLGFRNCWFFAIIIILMIAFVITPSLDEGLEEDSREYEENWYIFPRDEEGNSILSS